MRNVAALLLAVTVVGCKGAAAGQLAAAAITVGAAVAAAAINRAATNECWGSCAPGSYCDGSSGLCVAYAEPPSSSAEEPQADWTVCDRDRFKCEPNVWLRCEQPCEWVLCEPRATDPAGEPRRCCEQHCAWLQCPEDGKPCVALGHDPPKRDIVAFGLADPCRGLCLTGEVCVVHDGTADCVKPQP